MAAGDGNERLSQLEAAVAQLLGQRAAADINALHEERSTVGGRAADWLARSSMVPPPCGRQEAS